MKILLCVAVVTTLAVCVLAGWDSVSTADDINQFKKLVKAKKTLLHVFCKDDKALKPFKSILGDAATELDGVASIGYSDCSTKEGKKLCKTNKVSPDKCVFKFYKNGEFSKDYDRKVTASAISGFLKNPDADPAWSESDSAKDVLHLEDKNFEKELAKRGKVLVMFYAPWCGHCKALKPDFEVIASEFKAEKFPVTLAGVDADSVGRASAAKFDVKGYPTLIYFENGKQKYTYNDKRDKDSIKAWLRDPKPPAPPPPPEKSWAEEGNDVLHLTTATYDAALKSNKNLLVMFYAPWCGHCKNFKPHYASAATKLKAQKYAGGLAAVDCTVDNDICQRYGVKGFPTIKFFRDGELGPEYAVGRTEEDVLKFMNDPDAPPPPPPPAEVKWSDEDNKVVHLVGSEDFDSLKSTKHTIVMFYAPWCGHCKSTKPEFAAAAEELAGDIKSKLAAADCTDSANSDLCNKFGVKGYPTIKYFKYGKYAADYDGGRKKADFLSYFQTQQNKKEDL